MCALVRIIPRLSIMTPLPLMPFIPTLDVQRILTRAARVSVFTCASDLVGSGGGMDLGTVGVAVVVVAGVVETGGFETGFVETTVEVGAGEASAGISSGEVEVAIDELSCTIVSSTTGSGSGTVAGGVVPVTNEPNRTRVADIFPKTLKKTSNICIRMS